MQSTIHEHILSFLKNNNADKTLLAQWNSKENKDKLKDLVKNELQKKVKVKVERDPNKPSKNKTSFLFFCNDKRKEVSAYKNGKEVFKELGNLWEDCKNNNKKLYAEYESKALQDKKRYLDEIEKYKTSS